MNKDNKETLNPDFDINAKYEDMIKRAKHNVKLYLETGKNYTDINLSYDVKNYLPKALKEIQRLNNIIDEIKEKIDDYFAYDYENESMARLDTINEINHIIVELKGGK